MPLDVSRQGQALKQRAVKPIDRTNLAARVYMEIRESLIAGRFLLGERLRISEMAHAFGTSDTPVREALLRLVSEHALEMYAAKLIEVPPLSMARYIEIRTVRIALERLAVELAAPNVGKKELQELIKINSRFAEAESNRVAGAQMEHNRQFHFAIYSRLRVAEAPGDDREHVDIHGPGARSLLPRVEVGVRLGAWSPRCDAQGVEGWGRGARSSSAGGRHPVGRSEHRAVSARTRGAGFDAGAGCCLSACGQWIVLASVPAPFVKDS